MATHHEISSAKSKVRTKILVKKLNGLIKSIDTSYLNSCENILIHTKVGSFGVYI